MASDLRVQAVLQDRFSSELNATIVQVAHRLWSVAGCDRIAVLADGCLAELGAPIELLAPAPGGGARFREMVGHLKDDEAAAFHTAMRTVKNFVVNEDCRDIVT